MATHERRPQAEIEARCTAGRRAGAATSSCSSSWARTSTRGASIGTPLHAAADGKHAEKARLLIVAGANIDAKNREGLTRLELALRRCRKADLDPMLALVRVLLEAGAARTPAITATVERIGKQFAMHRDGSTSRRSVRRAPASILSTRHSTCVPSRGGRYTMAPRRSRCRRPPGRSKSDGAGNERLAALAVRWVLGNPEPAALPEPSYRR
ncbi:MAG: hypothetical protein ACRENE_19325 [Polyangiaceae bacterium]